MGTARKPKKRSLWGDFCDFVSAGLKSSGLFSSRENPESLYVQMDPLVESHPNGSEFSLEEVAPSPANSSSYSTVINITGTTLGSNNVKQNSGVVSDLTIISASQTHHSPAVVAAAQAEPSDAVSAYKTSLMFLTLAGITMVAGLSTGVFPLLFATVTLAVTGCALLLAAYMMNDEKKNGSLFDQTFPKFFENLPTIPVTQFSPKRSN